MIHSDYQYDGSLAPLFVEIIKKGVCDIVLGSRVRTRQECLGSGMPLYKYLANRLLTLFENLVTGENLAEWHTGYRAYSRKVLETIPYEAVAFQKGAVLVRVFEVDKSVGCFGILLRELGGGDPQVSGKALAVAEGKVHIGVVLPRGGGLRQVAAELDRAAVVSSTGLFVLAAKELAAIAAKQNLNDEARHYLAEAAKMEKTVHKHGWDGQWFIRAYDDFGRPVGSKKCAEGRIFIESQGICVMAGLGLRDGRARRALQSVNKHLATKHGIVLQQPAFSKYHLHLGEPRPARGGARLPGDHLRRLAPQHRINACGIAQCCDSVYPSDARVVVPRILVARGVLAARTLSDAIRAASNRNRDAGYNHLIAHESGEMYNVEVSARRFEMLPSDDGTVAHANHYLHPSMQAIETNSGDLINSRVRLNRARHLIAARRGSLDQAAIQAILADHMNYPQSICNHIVEDDTPLDRQQTIASLIIDLSARTVLVSWGTPCSKEFFPYTLEP